MIFIPPGGFASFAQQTPASRIALTKGTNGGVRRPRRRRKGKRCGSDSECERMHGKRRGVRASGRRPKSTKRKLKFGSPAWQKKYKVGRFAKR